MKYYSGTAVHESSTGFVQLLGGKTKIKIKLRGFNDTNNHSISVHEVGSIEDGCAAAGGRFNPRDSRTGGPAGGPDVEERSVNSSSIANYPCRMCYFPVC